MNAIFIIPTGIGAEIGGHAGDATPAARLLASVCDRLILHPNVVNASDINEMPANAMYVEGSILDRFMRGTIGLREPRSNRILVVANEPIPEDIVNIVSAARATLGINAFIVGLDTPLIMRATYDIDGKATGEVKGIHELIRQVKGLRYDALAVITPIETSKDVALRYVNSGGVNPWGGVEAIASRSIAAAISKPVAHAPYCLPADDFLKDHRDIVDPRMAAELVSVTYSFCILKGLHRSPRVVPSGPHVHDALDIRDVDVLISPHGCVGAPHLACLERGIPIIVVEENRTIYDEIIDDPLVHYVSDYEAAAGRLLALREGIAIDTLHRPMKKTSVNGGH